LTVAVHSEVRAGGRVRWETVGLAISLALAFAVRVHVAGIPRIVWGDEPFYLWLGQSLWAGQGYQLFGFSGAHFPPLFPAITGGLAYVAGGLQAASEWVYVLTGVLLVLPLWAIATRLRGALAGWATAMATAAYPALTWGIPYWGTMTEPLYLLVVALALHLLIQRLTDAAAGVRLRDYLLLGGLLGLAYLARTEALVLVPVMFGLLAAAQVWRMQGRRVARWPAALAGVAVGMAVFLVVALPFIIYLHDRTGEWRLTGAAGMAYVSMEGLASGNVGSFDASTWGLDPASREVYLFAPASEEEGLLSAVIANPRAFLRRLYGNLYDLAQLLTGIRLTPVLVTMLAVLGLFAKPWSTDRLWGELALFGSLLAPLSYVPFFVQDRYMAGILLPVLVWCGLGAAHLSGWLHESWQNFRPDRAPNAGVRGLLLAAPVAAMTLFLLWRGPALQETLNVTGAYQPAHLDAAAALRDAGAVETDVVLTRYPAIAFHAGTRWAPTPAAPWDDVLAYARTKGATYLVMDEREGRLRPQLAFLLDPAQAPAVLEHLRTFEDEPRKTLIYRFR
jgi:hypothetical protein